MAKKSRRTRSTPRLSSAQLTGLTESSLPSTEGFVPARRSAESAQRMPVAREDYSYVISDLKRIAVLAGSLFAIMIVLAFVLPYVIR